MIRESGIPTPIPPTDLIVEGQEWAYARFVETNHDAIETLLKSAFGGLLDIFEEQRKRTAQRIKANDGVKKFHYKNVYTPGEVLNYIECSNGEHVYPSEFLITPVYQMDLPNADLPPGASQAYRIDVLCGGGQFGNSEQVRDIDNQTIADGAMERFFDPDYFPSDIGIMEYVTTTREQGEGWADHKNYSLNHYSVTARIWTAKLREEFAPDPFEGPVAYASWRDDPGVQVVDMLFSATFFLEGRDGKPYKGMKRYVGSHGINDGNETWIKLRRFYDLLRFSHKQIVGSDLPDIIEAFKEKETEQISEVI